jgi:hypothetical protein
MQQFKGFHRVAVIIVPSDEEQKKRTELHIKEEGKEVPADAILQMQGERKSGYYFNKLSSKLLVILIFFP